MKRTLPSLKPIRQLQENLDFPSSRLFRGILPLSQPISQPNENSTPSIEERVERLEFLLIAAIQAIDELKET